MAEVPPPVPAEVSAFVEAMGREATIALLAGAGGTRQYIPARPDADSPLAKMIGLEAATKLGAAMGGDRPYIPLCKPWLAQVYRHERRMSISEVARALNVSEPTVRSYLRGDHAPSQLDFFRAPPL